MIKEFIFCVGLPGCGKSTFLESNYEFVKAPFIEDGNEFGRFVKTIKSYEGKYMLVSADSIKSNLDGYSNEHPENVHELSVKLARQYIYSLIDNDFDGSVILDGGGINNHYNQAIIEYFREHSPETKITCLFFDTPIDVCLKRVSERERKVPVESIYDKSLKLVSCLERYKPIVDGFVRIDYYTSEHIMLDMDGTIAAYGKSKYDIDGNKDFCCSQLFLHLKPVKHVIDFVKSNFDLNEVYICSAVANSVVWDEKNQWLDKYFPEIPKQNRLFVGNKDYKHVFVKNYCAMRNWPLNTVTLIDDYHPTIQKCEKLGINCVHPSNIESIVDKYSYQS